MNREKVQALMADAQEARATYQEAEAEYRKAAEIAFDTEFKTRMAHTHYTLRLEDPRLR